MAWRSSRVWHGPDFDREYLYTEHHQPRVRMLGDILASRRLVGGVDAGGLATGKDAAHLRQKPLWRIEADDVDTVVLPQPEGHEAARGPARLDIVLGPR